MSILDSLRGKPKPSPPENPQPRGGSGRGHTSGFLELEELNVELRHPQSHKIFDRMARTDADVHQVLGLSVNPLLGGTWDAEPYGGQEATARDIEVAEDYRWAVFEYMRPNLVGHLAQFLPVLFRSGFVPGAKAWAVAERNGKQFLVPKTIAMRLPRSIHRFHQDGEELTAIEQFLPTAGVEDGMVRIDRKDLVYYRVGAEGDNWEGTSLLRPAYKNWYLKDKIERIDAIAQEHEAMGIPIAYPPPSATPAQLTEMEAILGRMRTAEQAYVIMPGMKAGSGASDGTGWLLELLEFGGGSSGSGSGRDSQPSLQYHGNKIAAAFIAEFMKLGHGDSGARATAQVQADPFMASIEALATLVEQELHDSLTLPFVAYNYADVDHAPRLRMSLVDQTSLSQLADFVLKLTQVGALLPDQELEEFLRARADMPAPNPKSVEDRGDDEEMIRRMIVGGNIEQTPGEKAAGEAAGNNDDPFGSNAKVGKHKNGKPAGAPKKSGAPRGPGGAGKGKPRGAGKELSAYYDEPAAPSLHETSRWWELMVDLDGLALSMDDMPETLDTALQAHVYEAAGEMINRRTPIGRVSSKVFETMRDAAHVCLTDAYDEGARHVEMELGAQGLSADGVTLDRGARDRGGNLDSRAALVAERVELAMRSAMLGHDFAHGREGSAQAAAETAGRRALRRAGSAHGVAALIHGRHDRGHVLADAVPGVKVRYSAALDRGTCSECREADDGVARELDDPVRLERQPPNPSCESLHSGDNLCRCFEIFMYDQAVDVTLAEMPTAAPDMPPYLQQVMAVLVSRGMQPTRAFVVAVQVARRAAETGDVRWPGLRRAGAGNREQAAEAVEWIDRMVTAG